MKTILALICFPVFAQAFIPGYSREADLHTDRHIVLCEAQDATCAQNSEGLKNAIQEHGAKLAKLKAEQETELGKAVALQRAVDRMPVGAARKQARDAANAKYSQVSKEFTSKIEAANAAARADLVNRLRQFSSLMSTPDLKIESVFKGQMSIHDLYVNGDFAGKYGLTLEAWIDDANLRASCHTSYYDADLGQNVPSRNSEPARLTDGQQTLSFSSLKINDVGFYNKTGLEVDECPEEGNE